MFLQPALEDLQSPNEYRTSMSIFWNTITQSDDDETKDDLTIARNFIHVRDLARCFLRCIKVPDAGGQRFLVAGGEYHIIKSSVFNPDNNIL